jgi:glycosyltransferase involved in cell wall biosynthesis
VRIALVTNIPAPYRVPVFNRIADQLGDAFLVVFCAATEGNRRWDPGAFRFRHVFLKEHCRIVDGCTIHDNRDVLGHLRRFRPQVVITSGFHPTFLYAWAYALVRGCRHVPMTDGWIGSERDLGLLHRLARRAVYGTSSAFIGASRKSVALYEAYGVPRAKISISELCVDNERFQAGAAGADRCFDVLFSGQMIERKLPGFFVEVVARVRLRHPGLRVLVLGSGPLRDSFLDALGNTGASVEYAGHVQQEHLPRHYAMAKLLLFTTRSDPWGIVANEALASGTPVLTSPHAGVAGELVLDGHNGYIRDLDPEAWAERVVALLDQPELLARLRTQAIRSVATFHFDQAAQGILGAAASALRGRG